jgi:hypothetical protein
MSTKGRWLRTNEHLEAINSLEMVCAQIPKVVGNLHNWKWVIIALHNAVQGYMVLALEGSNSLDVYTDKIKKKWIEAFRSKSKNFPDRYMDFFPNLYNKIQDPNLMGKWVGSQPFKPEGTQTDSIEQLNEIRVYFIHFLPVIGSIEISGLPQIVRDCIDVIEFLTFKSGNIHPNDDDIGAKTGDLIKNIRLQINPLREEYESQS